MDDRGLNGFDFLEFGLLTIEYLDLQNAMEG